jgi:serine/threonine protein phosphatase PrpC
MDMNAVLEMVTRSDPGMVRSNNEDSVMANAESGFAVLADGMGGYNAGEVASGMATTMLGIRAGQGICRRSRAKQRRRRSGKTWAEESAVGEMALVKQRHLPVGAEPAPLCRDGHDAGGRRYFTTTR